jgi:hypothetical protein
MSMKLRIEFAADILMVHGQNLIARVPVTVRATLPHVCCCIYFQLVQKSRLTAG